MYGTFVAKWSLPNQSFPTLISNFTWRV